ncbi:MAG TPA: hypothetical protein VKU41_32175, partial [Polyangiaceae bacterium]|nr:hypothetical protein [Polyangiaceae bacterium]
MTRPGLAKARSLPLVTARSTLLVRASDARWRDLFARADVVSEGAVRAEAHGRIWYGSTSLILAVDEGDPTYVASLAERDVHVRLRAVRTACREASLRAPARLGRFVCEVRITKGVDGVRIDVDVQAP